MSESGSQSQHWDGGHRGKDSPVVDFHQHIHGSHCSLNWVVLEIQERTSARDPAEIEVEMTKLIKLVATQLHLCTMGLWLSISLKLIYPTELHYEAVKPLVKFETTI